MTAATIHTIFVIAAGDHRLAMPGELPQLGAWFEDQMNDGPIYIVVTPEATDERLALLGRRFGVEACNLITFRDSLASAVSQ
jgi:hypothetical protein